MSVPDALHAEVVRTGSVSTIWRERRLPWRGEVLVNEGQAVAAEDVVAEAQLPGRLMMLDIVRGLDIDPQDVYACLVRRLGEYLMADDVIAQDDGTFPRVVRTPVNGRFIGLHRGNALLEMDQLLIQVQAGMSGIVDSVILECGAVISTQGLVLQGVWGNGALGEGPLAVIEESWGDSLKPAMIGGVEADQIVAVGQCLEEAALDGIVDAGVSGLVVGSLGAGLISKVLNMPVPVVVLHGFGDLPADRSVFETLSAHQGAKVCVNAGEVNQLSGERPEVIIPVADQPAVAAVDVSAREAIRIGQRVRLYSGERLGQTGKVLACVDEPTRFSSGLVLPAVVVSLDNGDRVTTPQQNLIILG